MKKMVSGKERAASSVHAGPRGSGSTKMNHFASTDEQAGFDNNIDCVMDRVQCFFYQRNINDEKEK